jgi:hypothetical protein
MTSRHANAMAPANRGKSAARPREGPTELIWHFTASLLKTVLLSPRRLSPRRPRAFSARRENEKGTLKAFPEPVARTGAVRPWHREWATL